VDVSKNCVAWLDTAMFGIPTSGRVVPYSSTTLLRRRRRLHSETSIDAIQDGLRHTFASAWLTAHRDSGELAIQMGHRSPDVLYRHYYRAMTRDEAGKFWALVPTS
jgi:integrase